RRPRTWERASRAADSRVVRWEAWSRPRGEAMRSKVRAVVKAVHTRVIARAHHAEVLSCGVADVSLRRSLDPAGVGCARVWRYRWVPGSRPERVIHRWICLRSLSSARATALTLP